MTEQKISFVKDRQILLLIPHPDSVGAKKSPFSKINILESKGQNCFSRLLEDSRDCIDGISIQLNNDAYSKMAFKLVLEVFKEKQIWVIGTGTPDVDWIAAKIACDMAASECSKVLTLGMVTRENYKRMLSIIKGTDHRVIAQTPMDLNLCKQLNLLLTEDGIDINNIWIHHTTAGLGYGLEYVFSTIQRTRLSALSGDKLLSANMVVFIGNEIWRYRELAEDTKDAAKLGIMWETVTASSLVYAGAKLVVLLHPESTKICRNVFSALDYK